MLRRSKSEEKDAALVVDSTDRADRLEIEMRVIKKDLNSIRLELGDRINEVRKAIDEALATQ